jgi:hypothetical protein
MNYDDDWFWDEWEHEAPNDPVTLGTKIFIAIAALVALALIIWAI